MRKRKTHFARLGIVALAFYSTNVAASTDSESFRHPNFDFQIPTGWTHVTERDEFIAFRSADGESQVSFSVFWVNPGPPSVGLTADTFDALFEHRLAVERKFLDRSASLVISPPRATENGFIASYFGGEGSARKFTCVMLGSVSAVVTAYVESLGGSAEKHTALVTLVQASLRLK